MNVRKNSNIIQSSGIFKNRRYRRNIIDIREIDYKHWIFRTFLKLIICLIMFITIVVIKNINTRSTNFLIQQIDYRLNQEFHIADGYSKVQNTITYVSRQLEKTLQVINIKKLSETYFILPMQGRIVTYFNDIIEENNKVYKGIIIEGTEGEAILAAQEGVIIEIGHNQSSGNYIVIKHKGEQLSIYKNIAESKVQKHQKVHTGQVIGISSGKLLFEIWSNKKPVDPLLYIDLGSEIM